METRYRATVEYDGSGFLGFQVQAQGRTVQGELERAIERVTQTQTRVIGSGRTDAGVHALGQVVAFDVAWKHTIQDLQRALNAVLPESIAIRSLDAVHRSFHPRFNAVWRSYRYTIINQQIRSPLSRHFAYHVMGSLDLAAMQEASGILVGLHDFKAFGKPPQGEVTLREVKEAAWKADGPRLTFDITANSFLYRMVRNIVGTLLRVGSSELKPHHVEVLLHNGDRSEAGPPAPANGLCLLQVEYADLNRRVEGVTTR